MSKEKKDPSFILGVVLGSSVATIATLLFTPRNGNQNRHILSKTVKAIPEIAEDFSSTLDTNRNYLSQSVQRKWDNTLNRLKIAIISGIEASQNEVKVYEKKE